MKFITTTFLVLFSIACFGQTIWEKTTKSTGSEVISTRLPNSYQLYDVDITEIKKKLKNASERFKTSLNTTNTILTIPNREGELQNFRVLEAPMMDPALAARFPMIKTYIGQGIEDPTAVLNLSIGTDGLHVMIRAAGKSPLFIDPYTKDRKKYITYSKADQPKKTGFACGVKDQEILTNEIPTTGATENIIDGILREYSIVVATTIEYSAFHLNNQGVAAGATTAVKKAAILSAITTTMNRVKGIYETELSATFVLHANTDNVIFITSDAFTNNDANLLIDESQTVIDGAIGNANYDIGHTFSTGGGGLASLGGICTVTNKARAITGSTSPMGDSYDVDFVAHEIGHHFGANHTYNGINGANGTGAGNCTTSETTTSAEPGSGSTIMAYAGICSALNVQANSDAYFHIMSLKEINHRFNNTGNFTHPFWAQCSSNTNTGNQEPVANAGTDYTIPNGTAFVLTGSATDPDGGAMTYCWDQLDLAQPNVYPLVSATATGPLYRSFTPTSSPSRFMPAFTTVYNGSVQSTWEVTPTVARSLNFNMTVRDNKASAGQSTSDDMVVTVAAVGPFKVTSQNAVETWATGETKTISWDVAGTTANGINVANVEITLVNNTGTVLATLAASTPNDGSESITVPSTVANDVRIKVTAIGNIFYAVNSALIAVNTTTGYCNTLCASTGADIDGTTLVNFGTINNSSTGASAYTDYTGMSTDLVRGQSYNLTVNVNTGGNYQETTKVWIDWNRNCDFTDSGEEYILGVASNVTNGATSNSPLAITVPAGAELGDTRMRVTSAYSGSGYNPVSCGTGFAGEVEDYSLNILATALPVELTHFEAKVKDARAIQLDWHTATETNNAGFQIERSTDGIEFSTIGWVEGNGTSFNKNTYQYLDNEVTVNQRYYYRLKQVDTDGTFNYSSIQTAIILKKDGNIKVYPNPASDRITISLDKTLFEKNDVVFYLVNTLGQTLSVSSIEDAKTIIPLQNLPSGVYFYRITNGEETVKSDKLIIR
jgi:hypothetical protein